jgi:hypothetical protein
MSDPSSTDSLNGDTAIPGWMKAVDRDMVYDAAPSDSAKHDPQPVTAASRRPSPPSHDSTPPAEASSLDQKLALSMADPSDLPKPDPALQPTPVGSVRADLAQQLEKAVSVLGTRYTTDLSKSLLLEFALQRTLRELRTQGEESALVQWLDSVLPRP